MPDTTSGLPPWPEVSKFKVARLLRRGRARGSLTLDEVIDVVRDVELTSELIDTIRSSPRLPDRKMNLIVPCLHNVHL